MGDNRLQFELDTMQFGDNTELMLMGSEVIDLLLGQSKLWKADLDSPADWLY